MSTHRPCSAGITVAEGRAEAARVLRWTLTCTNDPVLAAALELIINPPRHRVSPAVLEQRNELVRRAARTEYPGLNIDGQAKAMRARIAEYELNDWPCDSAAGGAPTDASQFRKLLFAARSLDPDAPLPQSRSMLNQILSA